MAHTVGLHGAVSPPGIGADVRPEQFSIYAGVLPEDKYKLVKAFQKSNHTVGMCGDGANDAPALRQAQIGIAVSTATDRVRASPSLNAWKIRSLTVAGGLMGVGELVFCTAILVYGKYAVHMDLNALRTLAFVAIVFGNQATTYNNRERRRLWSSRPGNWVLASSGLDILIAATLSLAGIAMSPLPIPIVIGTLAGAAAFAVAIDFVKVPAFQRLAIT